MEHTAFERRALLLELLEDVIGQLVEGLILVVLEVVELHPVLVVRAGQDVNELVDHRVKLLRDPARHLPGVERLLPLGRVVKGADQAGTDLGLVDLHALVVVLVLEEVLGQRRLGALAVVREASGVSSVDVQGVVAVLLLAPARERVLHEADLRVRYGAVLGEERLALTVRSAHRVLPSVQAVGVEASGRRLVGVKLSTISAEDPWSLFELRHLVVLVTALLLPDLDLHGLHRLRDALDVGDVPRVVAEEVALVHVGFCLNRTWPTLRVGLRIVELDFRTVHGRYCT